MPSARVLVERFEASKDAGLRAAREGDTSEARMHFLRASEALFKLANSTPEGSLRESRVKNAEKLLEMARKMEQSGGGRTRAAASDGGSEGSTDADEWKVADKPDIGFDDIAGLEMVKQEILLKMVYPFTHAEAAERLKVARGGGLLLYGPPGTGKTLLARAVAGELDAPFFTVMPSEIMSKWVGESEQNIERLFDAARSHDKAVVFIDEVDALLPERSEDVAPVMRRVVPQILAELEGVRGKGKGALLFIGATNEPWTLDNAAMRPGRFDRRVYVGLPDVDARAEIFRIHLRGRPLDADIDLDSLAALSHGYSGADIRSVVETAANLVFLEIVNGGEERDIAAADLVEALDEIKPSVTKTLLKKFADYMTEMGVEA